MNPRIRLRHIRCFLETARIGSLSGAADALRISQPAVSKTLRELEEILCTDLFDRSTRRLVLNAAGRSFQQHAGTAMAALDTAEAVATGSAPRSERLAVGVLPSVAGTLFPRAAVALRDRCPGCVLRVSTGPNWQILSQLRDGGIDMMIGQMARPDQMEGLSFRHLYTGRVALVARPGHPLLGQPVTPEALTRYPLMLPPKGALIYPAVRAFLSSLGLQGAEPAFENVSLAFGRKVMQLSDTLWFIHSGVVDEELAQGSLVTLDLTHEVLSGPIGISLREAAVQSEPLQALIDILAELAQTP